MDVAGGEEDVNPGFVSVFEGLCTTIDVFLYRSRKSGNCWRAYFFCYDAHGFEVALGSYGKACLDNVYVELFQLSSHPQLVVNIHAKARGLLAVSECRIENDYSVDHEMPPKRPLGGQSISEATLRSNQCF
jgi:hypothetical protein